MPGPATVRLTELRRCKPGLRPAYGLSYTAVAVKYGVASRHGAGPAGTRIKLSLRGPGLPRVGSKRDGTGCLERRVQPVSESNERLECSARRYPGVPARTGSVGARSRCRAGSRPENLMCGRNWARAETLCGGRIAVAGLAGPWTKCRDAVALRALFPLHLGGLPTWACQRAGECRTGWPARPPSSRLSNSRPFMRHCCFRRGAGGL